MKKLTTTITICLIIILSGQPSMSQDAYSLIKDMDQLMQAPKDKQGNVKIVLTDLKSGKVKEREAVMKQKGTDKRLYQYTQPESQAGIATLSLPDGEMWMYMPAFGKPKKISLLSKSQAFTGTDFSYEDMETDSYLEKYIPSFLADEGKTFAIELVPKSDKSKYSKIIAHIDKIDHYPVLMEYFDNNNDKFKEATYQYAFSGKYWYAKQVVMTDLKKQHSTTIEMKDVKFDQGLTDDEFTVESMVPPDEEKK